MKYTHYNKETKQILGYYDDEIHESIPEPNFQISEEVWQKAISEGANFVDVKKKRLYRVEPEIDKKQQELAEALSYANELKENIRNALILGNEQVLSEIRDEYKELLTHIQTLKGADNGEI